MTLKVQFIHGLESSPGSRKARALAAAFDARTPAMDTSDFPACIALQARVLSAFKPDVLVGSSFGGAVALALLQSGQWHGPTLLLAQAAGRLGVELRLPPGIVVSLVHSVDDDIIDPQDSRKLAQTGTPGLVTLLEVHDDHALSRCVRDGELVDWVRDLATRAGYRAAP